MYAVVRVSALLEVERNDVAEPNHEDLLHNFNYFSWNLAICILYTS